MDERDLTTQNFTQNIPSFRTDSVKLQSCIRQCPQVSRSYFVETYVLIFMLCRNCRKVMQCNGIFEQTLKYLIWTNRTFFSFQQENKLSIGDIIKIFSCLFRTLPRPLESHKARPTNGPTVGKNWSWYFECILLLLETTLNCFARHSDIKRFAKEKIYVLSILCCSELCCIFYNF